MSNELTEFEAYIYHRDNSDAEFDIDNYDCGILMFSLMDSMQESYKEEYDELVDRCCNALDVSERVEAIHNRSTQKLLLDDEAVIANIIKEFAKEALKEAVYKLECQKEEQDPSTIAKVARELEQ